MTGTVERYLLDGPEEDTLVRIEIDRGEITEVVSVEDGRVLSPSVVSQRDYDFAIDHIIQSQL